MLLDFRLLPATLALAFLAVCPLTGAEFHAPALDRYAQLGASGSILPGGRVIQPPGVQIPSGPSTWALAASPKGVIATADIGPERYGVTVIEKLKGDKAAAWDVHHLWARTPGATFAETADPEWKSVSHGLAFASDRALWISEGASGRVRQMDIQSGTRQKTYSLNASGFEGSFTGGLAYDAARKLLFVLDRANQRLAVLDGSGGRHIGSVKLPGEPYALALAPDNKTLCVTHTGDSSSLSFIDVSDVAHLSVREANTGGTATPSGVLALADRVFISKALDDSVLAIDLATGSVITEIPLRIPGLNAYRGIAPAGLAYDPVTKWLLVAEAGMNAVGVIDTATNTVIAHLPAGWMPVEVLVNGDRVFVANARGRGTGPNLRRISLSLGELPSMYQGTVSTFIMPSASELPRLTGIAFAANGFIADPKPRPQVPSPISHVVLIVKGDRAFDEVLGDVGQASNGAVVASPRLARFGMRGVASGMRRRFSVQDAHVTPNYHALAETWAFSDNFYSDGDDSAAGERWLSGAVPDPFTYSRMLAGREVAHPDVSHPNLLRAHLEQRGIHSETYSEGANDLDRAQKFIDALETRYAKPGVAPPRFITLRLPSAHAEQDDPDAGYPYFASYAAENDLALGRVIDYLSHSAWWTSTAVFVTETSAAGGLDHVDSHRTLLLAAGPLIRRKYVSHTNASFGGLRKTILGLLGAPPLNLFDAAATDLRDLFTAEPDLTPFNVRPPDLRVFDPAQLTSGSSNTAASN